MKTEREINAKIQDMIEKQKEKGYGTYFENEIRALNWVLK